MNRWHQLSADRWECIAWHVWRAGGEWWVCRALEDNPPTAPFETAELAKAWCDRQPASH